MVHAHKVSSFVKTIKFGIEALQRTKQAFDTDIKEDNNLGRKDMKIEVDQFHDHETFVVLQDDQHVQQVPR